MPTDAPLPIPADARARDALLGRARALAQLDHPCLEPVGPAQVRGDGELVVPRGRGVATDLPTVLAVRGRLAATEACEVLVGAARGLAALHSAGLTQGSLHDSEASSVGVVDAGGLPAAEVGLGPDGSALLRPRLDASGDLAGTVDDGAAADVHALALLVSELLGARADDAATALGAVLAPALAPDPRVRPEAGTLAAQAAAAVAPEPVRLPDRSQLAAAALGAGVRRTRAGAGGTPTSRRVGSGRRVVRRRAAASVGTRSRRRPVRRPVRLPRRALGAMGVLAAVAVLVGAALQLRGPAEAPTEATAATPTAVVPGPGPGTDLDSGSVPDADAVPVADRTDPAGAAATLTEQRLALLTGAPVGEGDDGAQDVDLGRVDLAGSPAHDADRELLTELRRAGTTVQGLGVEVAGTRTLGGTARSAGSDGDDGADGGGDTARVEVTYEIGAHTQRAHDGTETRVPASGPRSAELGLTWTADGWRVSSVG